MSCVLSRFTSADWRLHLKCAVFIQSIQGFMQCPGPVSIRSVHRSYRKSSVHRQCLGFMQSVQGSYSVQCSYVATFIHTKSPGFMECPVSRVHAQCPGFIRSDQCSCVMSVWTRLGIVMGLGQFWRKQGGGGKPVWEKYRPF